jgi:hypothetical protein
LSHNSSPFFLVRTEIGSHFLLALALTSVPPFYASCCSWDDRYMPSHPAFSIEMWSHKLFCLDLPGTAILLISSS